MSEFAEYSPSPAGRGATDPRIEVVVRPAGAGDLDAIARLRARREGRNPQDEVPGVASFLDRCRSTDGALLLVAEADRRVLGYGKAESFTPDEGAPPRTVPAGMYLSGVVVEHGARRRGIASRLVRARLNWIALRSRRAYYFANSRNEASIALHRKIGFTEEMRDIRHPSARFLHGTGILYRRDLAGAAPSGEPLLVRLRREFAERRVPLPAGPLDIGYYGDSPQSSSELIAEVVGGRKRAGSSLLWAYDHDGEALPASGSHEIVLRHDGTPALVTRSTSVTVRPFERVPADYAAMEGEGDGSLAHWRRVHAEFFERECARIGRRPAANMPVVCCTFELVTVVAGDPG